MKRAILTIAGIVAALTSVVPSHAASILTTVQTDQGPAALAVHPATGVVYVGNVTDDTVSILAGTAAATKISVANPAGLAVDGTANRLYVASFATGKVFVYSTVTLARVGEFNVGGRPWCVDVDQASGRVFVANFETNRVHVLERDSNTGSAISLPGCEGAVGVAYNAATSRAFVTCIYSGNVVVVSNQLATLPGVDFGLGSYPWGIASHPGANLVYVSLWGGGGTDAGGVAAIDADTRAVMATATTGGAPMGAAVSRGGTPYVTLSAVNKLAVLNPSSVTVEESIDLPTDPVDGMNEPHAVAVAPHGALVYVGNYHAESVSIVNVLPRQ